MGLNRSSQPLILKERPRDGVALFAINRPEARNAISNDLIGDLAAAFTDAANDNEVRVVVLTGDAVAFSAGADIREMIDRGPEAVLNAQRDVAWATIADFPKPLIAAVGGICYGGGHELAMLADIVVAAADAEFAQPEVNIGLIPGDGATQRLTRYVGKSLAMKLMMTGSPIDAETARSCGLAADVVEPEALLDHTLALAEAIATKPAASTRLVKAAVLAAYETPLSEGLRIERAKLAEAFGTADHREGVSAFADKRSPMFGKTD